MRVLHLRLYPKGETSVELRFFVDNPNDYEVRSLSLNAITDLIEQAEQEYYFPQDSRLLRRRLSAENYASTGKLLYDWLDGSDRILSRTMQQYRGKTGFSRSMRQKISPICLGKCCTMGVTFS